MVRLDITNLGDYMNMKEFVAKLEDCNAVYQCTKNIYNRNLDIISVKLKNGEMKDYVFLFKRLVTIC